MTPEIDQWLRPFNLEASLHAHTAEVVASLPQNVRDDFMDDPAFTMCDYEPRLGAAFYVPVKLPVRRRSSRSVVLKRTLRSRPETFVRWVIAHELAHAHLRNGGRYPGDDPEHAADALAAGWGFPRPA
ncbi:MAG: hypothetical protein QOF78_4038 [Phycisphaerales bacterium]|jgi:hypothetical protein|nr:hypothetical protein [Phycisphaerales bacterium]